MSGLHFNLFYWTSHHIFTLLIKEHYAGPDKEIGATRMLAADLDRRYALTRG